MKHVIIGTAGHVDHGKTLLIKSLTGIETDRLKEEKKRGITIELGFAHIEFENGTQAGIVDVPGHESFVKNMLMGAGGVDFAMLIVAADEGFMPQTIEHLEILKLLNIKSGVVVITKTDLVEEDWLEVIAEEVAEKTKGSFLEKCEIIPVSAYTGAGMDNLKKALCKLIDEAPEKNIHAPFRLPVDRVFSIDGFGTVVTGTLIDGVVSEGDVAVVYPQGLETKIRNIQVHNENVPKAFAGQRVAINLAGLKKSDIGRGTVVAKPNSVQCTTMVDVLFSVGEQSQRVVKNGSTVHFFHGSASTLCKVILLEQNELVAGESGLAQLRLTDEIAMREGDRFVARFYSPLETIGGGVVLDNAPIRHRRNDKEVLAELATRQSGSDKDKVLLTVREGAKEFKSYVKSSHKLTLTPEQQQAELELLVNEGKVLEYSNGYFIDLLTLDELGKKLSTVLKTFHTANPLSVGMAREELRQKMFGRLEPSLCDAIIEIFLAQENVKLQNNRLSLWEFKVNYSAKHKKILDQFSKLFKDGKFAPPAIEEAFALFPKEKDSCKQVLDAMNSDGTVVILSPQIAFSGESYETALALLHKHFENNSEITLAQMRDYMVTSRKYALALLEYWDRIKLTKKQGDSRIL